jgi:hypothetical protein
MLGAPFSLRRGWKAGKKAVGAEIEDGCAKMGILWGKKWYYDGYR